MPILALLLGFFIVVFLFNFVISSYELVEINVIEDDVGYGKLIPVTLTINTVGVLDDTFNIPVYIDQELIYTFDIDYDGEKLGEVVTTDVHANISSDLIDTADRHTISTGNLYDEFVLLTAPSFYVKIDAAEPFYVTNQPFKLNYALKNDGESGGDCYYDILLDDTVISNESLYIEGEYKVNREIELTVDSPGVHHCR